MPVLPLRVGHRTAPGCRSTHRLLQLGGISQSGLDAALEVGGWRQMFRSLEHGGAAPVIIDRDYDLAKILPKLVKGGYYHSGQVCVSVQRVYVPRDRLEEIADPLSEMVAALKVDNAIHAHTDCGPLIRPREVDRVAQWVSEAQQRGAADSFGRHRCHVGLLVVPERDLVNLAKIDFFPDPVFILAVADPVNLHVVDTNGVVLVEREVT